MTCPYDGISRQVFYKWRQQYDQHCLDGFQDHSHGTRELHEQCLAACQRMLDNNHLETLASITTWPGPTGP